jgi:hypothetical protein
MRACSPTRVTKGGKIRTTLYFSPDELARLQAECERARPRASDGRFGISSLVQRIIREHFRLPPPAAEI